jgi:hypothetical protein
MIVRRTNHHAMLNFCTAQNTLDDIEAHLFADIFGADHKVLELVELNEANDTIRCWRFNDQAQLIKEMDNRPSFWPYEMGWHSIARPSSKVYTFKYNNAGVLDSILEVHTSEGKVLNTTHTYTYPNKNTFTKSHNLNFGKLMEYDFEFTQIIIDSQIQEIREKVKNHFSDGYLETVQISKYCYDNELKLKNIDRYFKVNNCPLRDEEEMVEALAAHSAYSYDNLNRLEEILELGYDEEGKGELSRALTFSYEGDSKSVRRIKVQYGKNVSFSESVYEVEYENNGDLKSISINGETHRYVYIR